VNPSSHHSTAYGADYVTRDRRLVIDEPEVRGRLVKAIDPYTAAYRKGCTPPDRVSWSNIDNNEHDRPPPGSIARIGPAGSLEQHPIKRDHQLVSPYGY
jgi:hypothetical protein